MLIHKTVLLIESGGRKSWNGIGFVVGQVGEGYGRPLYTVPEEGSPALSGFESPYTSIIQEKFLDKIKQRTKYFTSLSNCLVMPWQGCNYQTAVITFPKDLIFTTGVLLHCDSHWLKAVRNLQRAVSRRFICLISMQSCLQGVIYPQIDGYLMIFMR